MHARELWNYARGNDAPSDFVLVSNWRMLSLSTHIRIVGVVLYCIVLVEMLII